MGFNIVCGLARPSGGVWADLARLVGWCRAAFELMGPEERREGLAQFGRDRDWRKSCWTNECRDGENTVQSQEASDLDGRLAGNSESPLAENGAGK